jgi:hypothetical protein
MSELGGQFENPFASPQSEEAGLSFERFRKLEEGVAYRDGDSVVGINHLGLPARCVVCGEPATSTFPLCRLGWIEANRITNVDLAYGLCQLHASRRVYASFASLGNNGFAWLFFLLIMLLLSLTTLDGVGGVLCVVLVIASLLGISNWVTKWSGKIPEISFVRHPLIWIEGCGKPFVDQLPPYDESAEGSSAASGQEH